MVSDRPAQESKAVFVDDVEIEEIHASHRIPRTTMTAKEPVLVSTLSAARLS